MHGDVFAREQLLQLLDERAEVAADLHFVGLDRAGPVPHEQRIVPGCLPWMSSWVGAVTIASAMSGTVSDTRAIGEPTLSTVERPTSRSISVR